MELFLRAFTKASDFSEASGIASTVLKCLKAYGPFLHQAPKPYWKNPELYELQFHFQLSTRTALQTMQELIHESGKQWEYQGTDNEPEAILPANPEPTFIHDQIVWFHLEVQARQ